MPRARMLIGGLTGNAGGKESFILASFLALRNDYECWFLTDRDTVAYADQIRREGGRIVQVTPRSVSPRGYVSDLRALMRSTSFEVVWLNQTVVNSLEPLMVAKSAGVPLRVLHSHSTRNLAGRVAGVLHHVNRPLVHRYANRRLACSSSAAQWFFGADTYTWVPNAFEVSLFTHDRATRTRMRSALALPDDALVLSHVARFGFEKNHTFVVDIIDALVAQGVNSRLLLVGDGMSRGEVERIVHERGLGQHVLFLGSRDDVPDLLQASDVSVLPSIFEGLPYTVLEAQAAGLPSVVSDRVTRQCDASGLVTFLPLEDQPARWADVAQHIARGHERVEGANPLSGSPFDSALLRQALLDALSDG